MKTRRILALFCGLTLFLGGCSIPLVKEKQPNTTKESYADPLKYQSDYQTRLQYQHLNKEEQHCYGILYTAIKEATTTDSFVTTEDGKQHPGVRVPFDITLTKESMSRLYEFFLKDNPELFYLDRTYSLEGRQEGEKAVYDTLLIQFTLSLNERQAAIQQLNNAVDDILSDCPDTADDYVIEKYFHDYLVVSCVYDEEAASTSFGTHENAYSVYGALVEGRAVCEGYAKAMQLLLNKKSIPATVVMGYAIEDWESHMWNLVYINGSYYYLDVTWDDNDTLPHYTYFNITYDSLKHTHQPDEGQLDNIVCNNTADNYFVRNNAYCTTYERETIARAIAQKVEEGEVVIHLQFTPEVYANALLFLKDISLTQKKVNNQLGNRIKMWNYALSTQSNQYTITLIRTN